MPLAALDEMKKVRDESEIATRQLFHRVLRERLAPAGFRIDKEFNLTTGGSGYDSNAFRIWNGSYKKRISVWPVNMSSLQWALKVQIVNPVPREKTFILEDRGVDAALRFIKDELTRF